MKTNDPSVTPPGRLAQQLEVFTFVILSTLVVLYLGVKRIALDISKTEGVSVLALAAVIASLCVGCYRLKRLDA